jgi:hypothetical protein
LIIILVAVDAVTVALSIPLHNRPGASKSNMSIARRRTFLTGFAASREIESSVSERSE